MSNVQVLGICRWSYPSDSRGFRRERIPFEKLRNELYSKHRLEHRLFLLEHVFLPALKAQTDPNFKLIFLMGESLRRPYRKHVMNLLRDVPQIEPVFFKEGQLQHWVCRELLTQARDKSAYAVGEFRLDDDDAVSVDFVKSVRSEFADLRPLYDRQKLCALDFTQGFLMMTNENELAIRPAASPKWTPGLVIFQDPNSDKAVMDYTHTQLWRWMPVVSSCGEPMFIRGAHHDNDSNVSRHGLRTWDYDFDMDKLDSFLSERFGISHPTLQEIWKERAGHFLNTAPLVAAE